MLVMHLNILFLLYFYLPKAPAVVEHGPLSTNDQRALSVEAPKRREVGSEKCSNVKMLQVCH